MVDELFTVPPFPFEELDAVFRYDPLTGSIFFKKKMGVRGMRGREAGTARNGYVFLKYKSRPIQAHKVAWFLTHKEWPREMDHLNRDGMDNRLVNLEPVTHAENNKRRWQRASNEERRWRRNRREYHV